MLDCIFGLLASLALLQKAPQMLFIPSRTAQNREPGPEQSDRGQDGKCRKPRQVCIPLT